MIAMTKKQNLINNEHGLVSMVVTVLIILVLSLIVLSMARNANREQRQSLDRQLSSQAFYAAESGINDAVEYLKNGGDPVNSGCTLPSSDWPNPNGGIIDAAADVAYTCVQFDATPTEIQLDSIPEVGANKSKKVHLEAASGLLGDLTFTWKQTGSSEGFTNCPELAKRQFIPKLDFVARDCGAGVLHVGMIDTTVPPSLNNYFMAFLVPTKDSLPGSIGFGSANTPSNQGAIVSGGCDSGTGQCTATISVLRSEVVFHVSSIYSANDLTISRGGGEFINGQVLIDSTGRATDVLKRLQVRVNLENSFSLPATALFSQQDICKLLEAEPGGVILGSCHP